MTDKPSKTQTSFLRRLLVAYLIDLGKNTVPQVMEVTDMPRRTAQDTIKALNQLGIDVEQYNRGEYRIKSWGAVNPDWIKYNFTHVCSVLKYPLVELTHERNDMAYEQIVHDQALFCNTQASEIAKSIEALTRQKTSEERIKKAQSLSVKISANVTRLLTLQYIYSMAEREDLVELMIELTVIMTDSTVEAIANPQWWEEICALGGDSTELNYEAPESRLKKWRLCFLSKIKE